MRVLLALLMVLTVVFPCLAEDTEDEAYRNKWHGRLMAAFDRTAEAEYIAEIQEPMFPEFPGIDKAVSFRRMEGGKPHLRLELLKDGKLEYVFLQNGDGQFAHSLKSGVTVKGGDFMRLFMLDSMVQRPFDNGLRHSDYAIEENVRFCGRACTKVVVSLPEAVQNDFYEIRLLTGCDWKRRNIAELKQHFPFKREYLIDRDYGIVLSVKKWNGNGQLVSKVQCDKSDLAPDWEKGKECFAMPHYDGICMDTRAFIQICHDVESARKLAGTNGKLPSSGSGAAARLDGFCRRVFHRGLLEVAAVSFGWIAALAFLAGGLLTVWRRFKNKN